MAQALARKYRPQTFADLIGQEAIATTLANAIKLGRIHNAYIFTGTRGVGKTSSARIFAKALNCEHGPTPTPCGVCDSCVEIATGRSVDVLEIDAASHTKVEETRELIERVAYAPAKGSYRVFIIDEAHMLSKSSFNALLKTLEEPPAHAVFILATTEPQKILDTVRSRCLEFHFRRIAPPQIADALAAVLDAEGVSYERAAVERLAIEADGSMRDGLSLTDQVLGYSGGELTLAAVEQSLGLTGRDVVIRLWLAILAGDAAGTSAAFREAYRQGADLSRLGISLAETMREVIVAVAIGTPGEGALAPLVAAAAKRAPTDLHRLFDRLHAALVELERSPVPDVLLETVLLRLATLEPLGRLESLIEALTSGGSAVLSSGTGGARPSAAGAAQRASVPGVPAATAPASGTVTAEAATAALAPLADTGAPDVDPVPAILAEFPVLRSLAEDRTAWRAPELIVTLPRGQGFAKSLLETNQAKIEAALTRLTKAPAKLRIVVDEAAAPTPTPMVAPGRTRVQAGGAATARAVPDRRALLEDERLRELLDAFPGAEVVDIRLTQ